MWSVVLLTDLLAYLITGLLTYLEVPLATLPFTTKVGTYKSTHRLLTSGLAVARVDEVADDTPLGPFGRPVALRERQLQQ